MIYILCDGCPGAAPRCAVLRRMKRPPGIPFACRPGSGRLPARLPDRDTPVSQIEIRPYFKSRYARISNRNTPVFQIEIRPYFKSKYARISIDSPVGRGAGVRAAGPASTARLPQARPECIRRPSLSFARAYLIYTCVWRKGAAGGASDSLPARQSGPYREG
jgi:hypothetical protein